eukprot:GHVR01058807.1.p1 GENE.GHVR01058807.1~~GHVR01058807.1.p1  ORF type:complete len:295 (+),score=86.98 GHVR01058807.1:56-940(+)
MELPLEALSLTEDEIRKGVYDYLISDPNIKEYCVNIWNNILNKTVNISYKVDICRLVEIVPLIGVCLLSSSNVIIPLLRDEIISYCRKYGVLTTDCNDRIKEMKLLKIDLVNIPPVPSIVNKYIHDIRHVDSDRIVSIVGLVLRVGPLKVLEKRKQYKCNICGFKFWRNAEPYLNYTMDMPHVCPSGGGGGSGGGNSNISDDKKNKKKSNFRELNGDRYIKINKNNKNKTNILNKQVCISRVYDIIEDSIYRCDYQDIWVQSTNDSTSSSTKCIQVVILGVCVYLYIHTHTQAL